MALIQPFEDQFGNTNNNAYWKVVQVNCDYMGQTGHMTVNIYKSKTARNNGKQPLSQKSYDFTGETFDSVYGTANLDTNNPVKASYNYLKTLPEYASATDDL